MVYCIKSNGMRKEETYNFERFCRDNVGGLTVSQSASPCCFLNWHGFGRTIVTV